MKKCFKRIERELVEIMERKGYTNLSEFRGKFSNVANLYAAGGLLNCTMSSFPSAGWPALPCLGYFFFVRVLDFHDV